MRAAIMTPHLRIAPEREGDYAAFLIEEQRDGSTTGIESDREESRSTSIPSQRPECPAELGIALVEGVVDQLAAPKGQSTSAQGNLPGKVGHECDPVGALAVESSLG